MRGCVLVALLGACDPPPQRIELQDLAREFAEIAHVESVDEEHVHALWSEAHDVRARADVIVRIWRAAQRDFEEADRLYQKVATASEEASRLGGNAIAQYRLAEGRYRQLSLLLIGVAASSSVCAGTTGSRSFRATLRAEGVDLTGVDIDHVWPKSLGGVDHPLNYQMLDQHLNRSLGADITQKFMTQPLAVVRGLAASALAALSC